MKQVQVGIVLHKNKHTTKIYNLFQELFTIDNENEWRTRYILNKEPPLELRKAIDTYYAWVKEQNKEWDAFINHIAHEVLLELSPKERTLLYTHPAPTEHYFGLGLRIRNKYIYGQKGIFYALREDSFSSKVISRIASLLIENYDYENPFYHHLYEDASFNQLRRLYFAMKGEYPDVLMERYANEPDDDKAAEKCREAIRAIVLDADRFQAMCIEAGLKEKQYQTYKKFADAYNEENQAMIPYDVAVLASKKLDSKTRTQELRLLEAVLQQSPHLAKKMPGFVFNQKDAVLLAVSAFGTSLKRFAKFNRDDDIIRAALSDNGEAIQYVNDEVRDHPDYIRLALSSEYGNALKLRCMMKYRDSEEWVRIALKTNGCNIKWASPRLRDNFEMAQFAVRHQRTVNPAGTVCNLSDRLRDNLQLAMTDIKEGHACVNDYSRRLRDSDEIAEALIESGCRWKLDWMSKRIQKKYMND